MLGIKDAEIIVRKYKHPVKSASDGDYWRLLTPGTYSVTVRALGYAPVTKEVVVPDGGTAASYNFVLEPSFDAGSNTKFSSEVKMNHKKPVSVTLIIGLTVICTIALGLAVALMVMVVKKFKRSKDNVESGYVAVQSQSD